MKTKPAELHEMLDDAKELQALGLMSNNDVQEIAARVSLREFRQRIAAVRTMSASEIKAVRARWGLTQATLAYTLGMTVDSVSKWERGEITPSGPVLRILNTLAVKGPDVFAI
ncbi:putative transcriptional regulator [Erwinia persicina]|jgi:putative transcriptional regulator|uniref:Helix-turn-helix domain-containing protein n=2 Tax=Erwinia TaxID=551 RepID=A0ABV4E7W6_9GAMM|nr:MULTISPECIES: helix-turn-helix domain-containing protein [Erwinia]MCP1440380.1 putative transcriptional regulator [Erwinia persicina]MDN4626271.1 helix-turn-helix domain-containing protein [Erwinia sp. PsM31]MDN8542521.1 helix-turn-helix domain-containing protein [Erwinia sp. BC051422]